MLYFPSSGRKSCSSSGNSTGSEASSSSSISSTGKWKSTFSPISDPKQPNSDVRQGGSPFGMGSGRGTDSDSDHKQQQQVRKASDGDSSSYMTTNPFLSQEVGVRVGGVGAATSQAGGGSDQRQLHQKQKGSRDWELKTSSQNLFISAAASAGAGILSGKVGGGGGSAGGGGAAAVSSSAGSTVGSYLGSQFPLGGTSVLQSLFGAQTGASTGSGTPRLVNGHSSALGSFSSTGLAGGAAGGESLFSPIQARTQSVWDH